MTTTLPVISSHSGGGSEIVQVGPSRPDEALELRTTTTPRDVVTSPGSSFFVFDQFHCAMQYCRMLCNDGKLDDGKVS